MAYDFAQNPAKLNRAVATLQQEVKNNVRKDFSDADVKELYVKYGGLLVEGTEEEGEAVADPAPKKGKNKKAKTEDAE